MRKVAVITVLYNPTEEQIAHALTGKRGMLNVLVDNSLEPLAEVPAGEGVVYIPLNANTGIANAQNVGLRRAMEWGAEYVVFADHDTVFDEKYFSDITDEYVRIESKGHKLFALGPIVCNKALQREYKTLIKSHESEEDFVSRREIISSGSCASVKAIEDVGMLDAELFIDYVDFEWCWRAVSKGYENGQTRRCSIDHQVGHDQIRLGHYLIIVSAPWRYYYQMRNCKLLSHRSYVPRSWAVKKMLKTLLFAPIVMCSRRNGLSIAKYTLKGLFA